MIAYLRSPLMVAIDYLTLAHMNHTIRIGLSYCKKLLQATLLLPGFCHAVDKNVVYNAAKCLLFKRLGRQISTCTLQAEAYNSIMLQSNPSSYIHFLRPT